MKTKQKTLLALLVFALCAALFAVMTFTASAADVTLSGSGTRDDPYIVTSQEELFAASNASANVFVKLGKSLGVTSEFAVTNTLYLDLNSYQLNVFTENGIVVQKTSALYIFDTAGGGKICNNHDGDGVYNAITNYGLLYIENNVTIEVYTHGNCALQNYGTATVFGGKITAYIYNEGKLNIEGGEISQTIDNYGTVNISGGTVTTSTICIINYSDAKLSITGGSLISSSVPVDNQADAETTVTGGTLTGEWYGINNLGTLTVSGGTISVTTISGGSIMGESYGIRNLGTLAISGGTLIKGITNVSAPVKQCLAVGYAFFDESGHPIVLNEGQKEFTANVTIGKCTTHVSDNANCTVQTDCGACGTPYIDPTAHNFGETDVCACGVLLISEKTFPDEKFRAYISDNLDKDHDDILSAEEIAAVSSIDVSGKEIVSLEGIKYFTALTELRCYSNQLTSLDVSGCTALTELYCYSNQLASLDVSGCSALEKLNCYSNQLASLDVSGCSALTELDCNNNDLTSLDVRTCTALTELYCYSNQLTRLDVSGCTELISLDCIDNQLASLDVSGCSALTKLKCYSNQLTRLDVSTCTALTELHCLRNKLTSLDVSTCTALTELDCNNNDLTSLDVSDCSALTKLMCYSNQLTRLDVSGCSALTELNYQNNQLTSLDVSGCTALTELNCYSNNQLTSLDVSGCTALTELYCYSNKLISLDVSGCTALIYLDCNDNQLTSLDVRGCTALTELYCYSNKLISLDVSTCTALTKLRCYNNQLTSLDVSTCTALTYLACNNNQLASLDVSDFTELKDLDCYSNNQLTSLDVSGCTALKYLDCYSNNQLTSLDVSGCTALEHLSCYSNQLTSLDVSGCTALEYLGCSNNQLTSLDVSECSALTQLVCYSNKLTSFDVSGCTALTYLHCNDNQLTSLDVSGCTALTELVCNNNQLTSLDVSTCTALTYLACYNNQLTSLDLANNASLSSTNILSQQLYITEDDAKNYTVPAGFDASKAINITGGVFDGNVLAFNESATSVKYTYETGLEGITMDVIIYIHEHYFGADHICTYCGAKKAEASQVSVTLDGDIGVNFYWTLQSEVISDTSAYFLVKLPNGNTERFDVSAMTTVEKDGALYYRVTGRVAAKEMADDVVVELYAGDELIASANCSVRGYADRAFKYSDDAELIAMMKAMLNYGAASQMLFGHNTSDLANSILAEGDKAVAAVDKSQLTSVSMEGSVAGFTPVQFSCILETKTTLRHYFTVESGNIAGYTFKVGDTEVKPKLISGNTYCVDIENISAADLGTAYTFTITDGTTTQTITASVESYMNSVIVNKDNEKLVSTELLATVYAMHAYGTSAETYFK